MLEEVSILKSVLISFLLVGFAGSIASESKPGLLVHSDNYTGVIFPAEKRAFQSEFEEKNLQYWSPSEADVQIAENEIYGFLQAMAAKDFRTANILKKLKTYTRQYAGIITGSQNQIYMNFFCVIDRPKDRW